MKGIFTEIDTELIDPSPYQKRQRFDPDSLQRLADDIKLNELLNPILCRPLNGRYELVHGERRWRAVKSIPWQTISAQVREMTDLEARRICTAENVHRVDLTAIELIEATADLLDAQLCDIEEYQRYGNTYLERVSALLGDMFSAEQNKASPHYVNPFNKFIKRVDIILGETNRGITWQSFYANDLRPYLKLDEDVKEVAIDQKLSKSKAFAVQKVKEAAPKVFEHLKETGQVDFGPYEEKCGIEDVSTKELERWARWRSREREYEIGRLKEIELIKRMEKTLPPTQHDRCIFEDSWLQLWWAEAQNLFFLSDESIDLIVTSPSYNIGPKEGKGRILWRGVRYDEDDDSLPEDRYQSQQIKALNEMWRVARPGASLFYNHKVRNRDGVGIHPLSWILKSKWVFRQEIIWDRGSTHNHEMTYFWPVNECIFWLTKGSEGVYLNPEAPQMTTIWRFPFAVKSDHPAPFPEELARRCITAASRRGDIVLDPFGGSMTTCFVAKKLGRKSIGLDRVKKYVVKCAYQYRQNLKEGIQDV